MTYDLVLVTDPADLKAYHAIRRQELFDGKDRQGVYDDHHPADRAPGAHPFLLKYYDQPIGTTRLDIRDDGTAVFRMVAIAAAVQGQGHGRVLVQMVEERAKVFTVKALLLNAAPEAVGFYEKSGWSRHQWDTCELVGAAVACVQMAKWLQA